MYTINKYRQNYDDCRKSLDLAKDILKQKAFEGILPPPEAKKLRQSLLGLFSKPELSKICKNCGGDCCVAHNFHLTPLELICLVSDNPDFVFPEPDWQFLEKELKRNKLPINNRCLFLSDIGCLLKEYRPIICLLFYDCRLSSEPDSLKEKLWKVFGKEALEEVFFTQAQFYRQAKEIFCLEFVEASGIPKGSLSAIESNGALAYGVVGSRVCLQVLENLLHACKNKGRS